MVRSKYSLPPLLGLHGCDREIGEAVLSGDSTLSPSSNDWDWLGSVIYFWVDSYRRGSDWATHQSNKRNPSIKNPFVLGAFIYPGLCLNLTDYGVGEQLAAAYKAVATSFNSTGVSLPENKKGTTGISLRRHLDCAVINMLHAMRKEGRDPAYDTVYGFFEEGIRFIEGVR